MVPYMLFTHTTSRRASLVERRNGSKPCGLMTLQDGHQAKRKEPQVRSVLRRVGKRKKSRRLGEVEVISREEYSDFDLDAKVEAIRALIPLGLMHVQETLEEEVTALAGERYVRKEASMRGRRHGSNPGTVGLAGQRVPIRVPRVRSITGREIPLRSYEALSGDREGNELLLKRVLYGISCRNYETAAESIPRGDRSVEFDGVARIHRGEFGEVAPVPGARPVWRGCRRLVSGRQDVCRCNDGGGAGRHDFWGETLPGLRGDGHREREGPDAFPALAGRAEVSTSLEACW